MAGSPAFGLRNGRKRGSSQHRTGRECSEQINQANANALSNFDHRFSFQIDKRIRSTVLLARFSLASGSRQSLFRRSANNHFRFRLTKRTSAMPSNSLTTGISKFIAEECNDECSQFKSSRCPSKSAFPPVGIQTWQARKTTSGGNVHLLGAPNVSRGNRLSNTGRCCRGGRKNH